MITAPTSKYVSPTPPTSATTDQPQAASVPIETRVYMDATPWRALRAAARWNGPPAQSTNGLPSANASPSPPSHCSAGIISGGSMILHRVVREPDRWRIREMEFVITQDSPTLKQRFLDGRQP